MSGNIHQNYEPKQSQNDSKNYSSDSRFPSSPRNAFTTSDSDSSDSYCMVDRHTKAKKLPPIGVFWDIENCQVPKGRSAVSVAQLIRDLFFTGYREAEFVVVCDVKKESSQIVQELNDAQVTLIHVASTCKNAADEKLRQALRRFADTYCAPAAVILISSDINFAADLSDLRHRKKLHVILIHKENAADALILCASEHYNYTNITQVLPLKETKPGNSAMEVIVRNLPKGYDPIRLRNRLKQLSDNCGGRVVFVSLETGTAVVRFNNLDVAVRAQRRMDGEDVYGNKISVSYPNTVRNWEKSHSPYRIPARKITKNPEFNHSSFGNTLPVLFPSSSSTRKLEGAFPKEYLFTPSDFYHIRQQKKSGYAENSRPLRVHNSGNDFPNNETWRPHSASFTEGKRSWTPNDVKPWSRNISGSFTALNTLDCEDSENSMRGENLFRGNSNTTPVDLLVTNLDQSLDPQDLKTLLLSMFQECSVVISLSLFHQSDGNLGANVRVFSHQDAQYVISQLHRRKIGHKRIFISYAQTSVANPHMLRTLVISLLQEVPGNRMPLFKFRELLETKYRTSIPVSELYKLKDVCSVNEELGGRMISLNLDLRTTPSPHLTTHSGLESAYCVLHCPNGLGERGWAEPDTPALPNVRFKLKIFTTKVHELLHSHMGTLPLTSFPICYELENGEKLPVDESGVPLEHLVTCVAGVELKISSNMIKYLVWGTQSNGDDSGTDDGKSVGSGMKCVSPPLASQLALFSRELVDLLKTAPHCQLAFSRFIPAYHHHFGRQCRVADYGHTRLAELLEALPHVVQVLGEGNRRALTLAHAAQLRRFTADLLRVLKAQASKQLALSDFSGAYERALNRAFDPVDYGLCHLTDLLSEVPENTIVIKLIENETFIAIPKKEQTPEEIMKTKQFSFEVVDLLKHAPQYAMMFNKFVPAYHHHFGHQCRVSDYGFSKLIELFEAIPDIVKIEDMSDGERKVSLTPKEALKVLQQQLISLVKNSKMHSIPLVTLLALFSRQFGYLLRPELYECSSFEEIVEKMSGPLQVVSGSAGSMLIITEEIGRQSIVRGRRNKKHMMLNKNIPDRGVLQQNMQEERNENVHWPPPPTHTYLFNCGRNTSPPKPDTPPTAGASHWDNSIWNSSANITNLCIPLPFVQTPPIVDSTLMSPMKNLLPAFPNTVQPPEPCELPMPNKLLNKVDGDKNASPSKDSGISSNSFTNSGDEPDSSTNFEAENTTPKKKRQLRLAAHFTTPMNLT